MSVRKALLTAALAAVMVAPAGAVTLRLKFKAGDKVVYRDQMALAVSHDTGDGEPARLQMRSDSKVRQSVKHLADGVATLELETIENSTETIPDGGKAEKSEDKGEGERIKISERGLISERASLAKTPKPKDEGIDSLSVLQRCIDGMTLPEEDIEVGGEWTDTYEVALTEKGLKGPKSTVDLTGRLERLVTIKGRECAEIIVDFSAPLDVDKPIELGPGKVTAKGQVLGHLTMYLDLERGDSMAEAATYGGHLALTMEAGKDKVKAEETFKMNTKTHRVD